MSTTITVSVQVAVLAAALNQLFTPGYSSPLGTIAAGEPQGGQAVTRQWLPWQGWKQSSARGLYSVTLAQPLQPIQGAVTLWTALSGGLLVASVPTTAPVALSLTITCDPNVGGEVPALLLAAIIGAASPLTGPFLLRPTLISNIQPLAVANPQYVAPTVSTTGSGAQLVTDVDASWAMIEGGNMNGWALQDAHYTILLSYITSAAFAVGAGETVTMPAGSTLLTLGQ